MKNQNQHRKERPKESGTFELKEQPAFNFGDLDKEMEDAQKKFREHFIALGSEE